MLRIAAVVLYTALMLGANGAAAQGVAAAGALREGDMRKLVFHAQPRSLPEVPLLDMQDAPRSLEDYRGKWVVLNFWATWCPPCRKEMPGLDRLQAAMGGPGFEVVTVATGRNAVPGILRFFEEAGVTRLAALRDPGSALARGAGVMGLPVTVILDPAGREVGRLIGDAEWDTPAAKAMLAALIAGG